MLQGNLPAALALHHQTARIVNGKGLCGIGIGPVQTVTQWPGTKQRARYSSRQSKAGQRESSSRAMAPASTARLTGAGPPG